MARAGRARVPSQRHRHGRRRELLGGGGRRRCRRRAPRDGLPRGVRSGRVGPRPLPRAAGAHRTDALEPRLARHLAARAVHLHARGLRGMRGARAPAHDPPRPRARRSSSTCARVAAPGRRSATCSSSRRARPASAFSPTRACSGPAWWPRTACTRTRRRSSSWPRHGSAWRTARARTPTSAAASPRSSGAAPGRRSRVRRDRQPRVDAVVRHVRRDARPRSRWRGRESATRRRSPRADALELATLGGARALGREGDLGSLTPGKQADLVVVSLEDSPFAPVEDPALAVVLGGSPDRVVATLVAGEERYRKGTSAWPDSTRAARSARSRMLR